MQVIYIDILLLINFSMDFVALFLTARLMHARAKAIPLAAASLIGAGYEALRLFKVSTLSAAKSGVVSGGEKRT